MIIKEQFYVGGKAFTRVRSNTGRYVVRDGIPYISACDPIEFGRQYVEGEVIPLDDDEKSLSGLLADD